MASGNRKTLRDYGITACAAVLIAFAIRGYLIEAYRIPSSAMSPSLIAGDTIFVLKWPYSFRKTSLPEQGEVIVFAEKADSGAFTLEYIRRVIGLPGDRIDVKRGRVFLNDKELIQSKTGSSQPHSKEELPNGRTYSVNFASPLIEDFHIDKVPDGHIFVIGDSRSKSSSHQKGSADIKKARGWGVIPISAVKGKAFLIWISIDTSKNLEASISWPPQFRFDRMLRRIE